MPGIKFALLRNIYSGNRSGLGGSKRRLLLGAVILTLLFGLSYASARVLAYNTLAVQLKLQQEQTITIGAGQGLISVINELSRRGNLEHPQRIKLAYYVHGVPQNLQQGEYTLAPGMRLNQLIDNISKGKQQLLQFRVDIGVTFKDFYNKLIANPNISKTTAGMTPAEIMQLLGTGFTHPEGLFYADTYSFYAGEDDITILRQSHQRLLEVLDRHWRERRPGLKYANKYEALIMASIIEKETGLESERQLISGVFQNRLKRGMKLQTDPTVIYGMGDSYQGNIRRSDLRRRTPYNTYVIEGLPPTPIALVDERAIEAALNPKRSDYIFFVAKHDGSGSHHFSTNYEEHKQAVRKYQLKQ